jgi:AraC family transcriptional regulator of adaptative response/methylated-DNA-[protein]-cysteine methyltransferase
MTTTQPIPTTPPDDPRWSAVLARDAASDGSLVYGVRSTGIYCRPSCPARRPSRANVTFFETPAQARAAGFRPCRRCRPDQPLSQAATLVRQVQNLIASAPARVSLGRLAAAVGKSPWHLHRTFKRLTGLTPREYAAACRLERLKLQLRTARTVSEAQYAAGYGSSSRLYERAQQHLGMTPSAYRRGGRGIRIGYRIVATPLGPLLVAGTERGLCLVKFGSSAAGLEQELRREFPQAHLVADHPRVKRWAQSLEAQLRGLRPSTLLPLDLKATAFQWQVWRELRRIPYGQTRTYQQVAEAIGRPRAVRAVAQACASNPVVVAIPCHRVIRSDGTLGGYRCGLRRKRALLRQERHS